MITAKEARALDPNEKVEADLETLARLIRASAEKGLKSIRVPYAMTDRGGYQLSFKRKWVYDTLLDAGYTVTERASRQFVDVWFEISWGADDD